MCFLTLCRRNELAGHTLMCCLARLHLEATECQADELHIWQQYRGFMAHSVRLGPVLQGGVREALETSVLKCKLN